MSPPVVYIDDEAMLCRAFEIILGRAKIPVTTFTDPLVALEYLRTNDVSLVFCDYRMPGLNGLELLDRLDKQLQFYVVSGDLGVGQLTALNPRVAGTLTKPFRSELILEIVRAHLAAPTA